MIEQNKVPNKQANDQDLPVNESKMFDKVGRQRNSYRNGNIIIPAIHYNKN